MADNVWASAWYRLVESKRPKDAVVPWCAICRKPKRKMMHFMLGLEQADIFAGFGEPVAGEGIKNAAFSARCNLRFTTMICNTCATRIVNRLETQIERLR